MENAFVGVINMLNYFSWRVKIQQVAILCMIFLKPIVNRITDELKRPENFSMLEMIFFLPEKKKSRRESFPEYNEFIFAFLRKWKKDGGRVEWRSRIEIQK